mmetsp:Transcript_37929/g.122029  ORF Transcript_37929/g.122029 Transcript_37929/m.122029 type:complete len:254 (-) Transcript_37929:163-924(-)
MQGHFLPQDSRVSSRQDPALANLAQASFAARRRILLVLALGSVQPTRHPRLQRMALQTSPAASQGSRPLFSTTPRFSNPPHEPANPRMKMRYWRSAPRGRSGRTRYIPLLAPAIPQRRCVLHRGTCQPWQACQEKLRSPTCRVQAAVGRPAPAGSCARCRPGICLVGALLHLPCRSHCSCQRRRGKVGPPLLRSIQLCWQLCLPIQQEQCQRLGVQCRGGQQVPMRCQAQLFLELAPLAPARRPRHLLPSSPK